MTLGKGGQGSRQAACTVEQSLDPSVVWDVLTGVKQTPRRYVVFESFFSLTGHVFFSRAFLLLLFLLFALSSWGELRLRPGCLYSCLFSFTCLVVDQVECPENCLWGLKAFNKPVSGLDGWNGNWGAEVENWLCVNRKRWELGTVVKWSWIIDQIWNANVLIACLLSHKNRAGELYPNVSNITPVLMIYTAMQ